MVYRRKVPIYFTITIILITLLFLLYFNPYIFGIYFVRKQNNAQKRLLCETNFKLLLETCRELPKPIPNHGRKYYTSKNISSDLSDELLRDFKNNISNLNPKMVYVDDNGCVSISFGNTFWHFGVRAYPKDFQGPLPSGVYGDRELIPGLWYYDELYESNPNYGKEIDKLVKKNKYLGGRN